MQIMKALIGGLFKSAEPEITVHKCPDKMSDQIQKCSDTLKIWSDITTMFANFVLIICKMIKL